MILKDKEHKESLNKFDKAGQNQELDVAFHLRRRFKDRDDVIVINDLKFEFRGEITQIDHLVIYKYGFIVVESKSITGNAKINKEGEWSRSYNDKWYGIASPIEQANSQTRQLALLLDENREKAIGKMLFGLAQQGFGGREWEILIALSSNSIIERDNLHDKESEKIIKSEFIGGKIAKIIDDSFGDSLVSVATLKPKFSNKEMLRIANFILDYSSDNENEEGFDKDIIAIKKTEVSDELNNLDNEPSENDVEGFKCGKCENDKGLIPKSGRFGYYVLCPACKKNTSLKINCVKCSSKHTSVHKRKEEYRLSCSDCKKDELFVFKK